MNLQGYKERLNKFPANKRYMRISADLLFGSSAVGLIVFAFVGNWLWFGIYVLALFLSIFMMRVVK